MTPKLKALKIVESNYYLVVKANLKTKVYNDIEEHKIFLHNEKIAKEISINCVNEIIKCLRNELPIIGKGKGYWYSVRKEINKL